MKRDGERDRRGVGETMGDVDWWTEGKRGLVGWIRPIAESVSRRGAAYGKAAGSVCI